MCGKIQTCIQIPDPGDWYEDIVEVAKDLPPDSQKIIGLWINLNRFLDTMRRIPSRKINAKYAFDKLEFVFPPRIESVLGRGVKNAYIKRFQEAKDSSQHPRIVSDAAVVPVVEILNERIQKIAHEISATIDSSNDQ